MIISDYQIMKQRDGIAGLAKDCSANALELLQSCTKPSVFAQNLLDLTDGVMDIKMLVITTMPISTYV